MSQPSIKILGRLKASVLGPEESHRRALGLIRQMDRLNPYPRPRGFVFKAQSWKDYEKWREKQENPRLW